nr:uncharacterized protein LOC109185045 [Ipomoea trifida]
MLVCRFGNHYEFCRELLVRVPLGAGGVVAWSLALRRRLGGVAVRTAVDDGTAGKRRRRRVCVLGNVLFVFRFRRRRQSRIAGGGAGFLAARGGDLKFGLSHLGVALVFRRLRGLSGRPLSSLMQLRQLAADGRLREEDERRCTCTATALRHSPSPLHSPPPARPATARRPRDTARPTPPLISTLIEKFDIPVPTSPRDAASNGSSGVWKSNMDLLAANMGYNDDGAGAGAHRNGLKVTVIKEVTLLHGALALLVEAAEACLLSMWRKLFSTLLFGISQAAAARSGQLLRVLLGYAGICFLLPDLPPMLIAHHSKMFLLCHLYPQGDTWSSSQGAMFESVLKTRDGKRIATSIRERNDYGEEAHPWFKGIEWDKLCQMKAAFIPQVNNDELDTQNFEKFEETDNQVPTATKSGPWRKITASSPAVAASSPAKHLESLLPFDHTSFYHSRPQLGRLIYSVLGVEDGNTPSIAQVHHVVLRDHQEVIVKMSQRKRNRGKGKTVTGSHSQADISQPPSLHALIDDLEEGSTPVMETPRNEVHRMLEDTASERTPSSSRPTEHTTEGLSEHTSYAASESIDEATLGGGGEGMTTESPPSTIPADRFTTFIRTVGGTA